ncbi:MAG: radical SAM protein [Bacteroidales bacterium]|nr:radical SAM protein [Bacteroidales bacterium]
MNLVFNKEEYTIRVEYFGGLLINRRTMIKYQISKYDAVLLNGVRDGYDIDTLVEGINKYFGVMFSPDRDWFIQNKVLVEQPGEGYSDTDLEECIQFLMSKREEVDDIFFLRAPIELTIYPTFKCQMNCEFCFAHLGDKLHNHLVEANKWNRIIDEFVEEGVSSLSILGGEPTLYPYLADIIKHVDGLSIRFTLTTNGLSLSKDLIDVICNTKNLTVVFSIDLLKPTKVEQNSVHKSDIDRIKELMNIFTSHGVQCRVNTVFVGQKEDELKEIADFCNSYKVEKFSLALCYREEKSCAEDILKINKMGEYLRKYINDKGYRFLFTVEGCMLYSSSNLDGGIVKTEFQKLQYGCECGNTILEIAPDGTLYACASLIGKQPYIGNVFTENWKDAWYKSTVLNNLRKRRSTDEKCINCTCYDFCGGGCPAYIDSCKKAGKLIDFDDRCLRRVNSK